MVVRRRSSYIQIQEPHYVELLQDEGMVMESEEEFPNEYGNTTTLRGSNTSCNVELTRRDSSPSIEEIMRRWEMNYHEAAIFLEEGENNDKFDSHPRNPDALPAYLIVHNRWYYGLDMATSLVLLSLGLVEDPAVPLFKLPVGVHGSIELFALTVIGIELFMKLRWLGWMAFVKHKRTTIKGLTLLIMVVEAIVVLVRQSSHFRVTRSLRPIFLVDNRYCGGVRRFIRQVLQSLPPILDMLGLLLFFMTIYSLLGFYLFSRNDKDPYFKSLHDSFVSLFVLLTTANYPDVMMPSYDNSRWTCVFFISYLAIVLYFLMNLMLAVVYEAFTTIEREKFKKLLLHKRKACQHAFKLLVSKQSPTKMKFRHFEGLMKFYAPKKSKREVLLMYKVLNKSQTGAISLDEFYNVYDAVMLEWQQPDSDTPWFHQLWPSLQKLCKVIHKFVTWKYFEHGVYILILANGVCMVVRTFQSSDDLEHSAWEVGAAWDTILFIGLYAIEAILKVVAYGLQKYFSSGWNVYDFTVTLIALLGIAIKFYDSSFTYIVILRPLRLLRLFKLKKRYRDVFGTLFILLPLMCSVTIVILLVYYFFGIIGMEVFSGYDMKNCCVNTTVEAFYKFGNTSASLGYYYLNSFDNLLSSGVTLFELTVVNNWFVIMNGYAAVTSQWSRIYFMVFYLVMMVVLTIVVASILEAFRFRIQYKQEMSKHDEEQMLHEEVSLKWDELESWVQDLSHNDLVQYLQLRLKIGERMTFTASRPRTREVLQQRMFKGQVEEWMKQAKEEEVVRQATVNSSRVSQQTSPSESSERELLPI